MLICTITTKHKYKLLLDVYRAGAKVKCCPVTHLCDTKGDIAHIEPTSLSGHLATHYRYWGWSNSQAIWSHGRQEGCSWDLACSWSVKTGNI